jgi:phosphosulfolactate synthase (CoM biosynthesis protein A)
VRAITELCHGHDVLVSTGGFMEYVLTQGRDAVKAYIRECKDLGFDIVEISAGFITLPTDDWLRLIEAVQCSSSASARASGGRRACSGAW